MGCPDGRIAESEHRSELFCGCRYCVDDPEVLKTRLQFVNRSGQMPSIWREARGFQIDVGGAGGGEAAAGAVDPGELGAGGVFLVGEDAVGGNGKVGGGQGEE